MSKYEKIRLELHTHTKYSHDSNLSKFFYLIMLKLKRIKYVAICDHNEIMGAVEYKQYLSKYGINVIVGEEIFTKNGEIIGLFLEKKIEPFMSVEDTIEAIKNQDGLVYIPHPYDEKRYKTVVPTEILKNNCEDIDIIEVHNGRNIKKIFSQKQEEIAGLFPNVIRTVGSDAHCFFELGRNYIEVEEFDNKEDFLIALTNAVLHKKECINFAHHTTKFVRIYKMMLKGNFNEIYRIIYKRFRKRNT